MKIIKKIMILSIIIIFVNNTDGKVYADNNLVECVLTAEDNERGYIYSISTIEAFATNCKENDTVEVAYFEIKDSIYPVVLFNDEEIEFEDGNFIESGKYTIYFYLSEDKEGDYAKYNFTIENDYDEIAGMNVEKLILHENPELEMRYDSTSGNFIYTLPNDETIALNTPIGGRVNYEVKMDISENIRIVDSYIDGEKCLLNENDMMAEFGNYNIILKSNEFGTLGDNSYELSVCFSIVPEVITNENIITSPKYFELVEMKLNDNEKDSFDENHAIINEDGNYVLKYISGDLQYTYSFIKDGTPPRIEFDQETDSEIIISPIKFENVNFDNKMEIIRNSKQIILSSNIIDLDGNYEINIIDKSGNQRTYKFIILQSEMNWTIIIIAIAGVILSIVLAIYSGKKGIKNIRQ